jgi:hypothetical protein
MTADQFVPLNRTFREVGEDDISSDSLDSELDWYFWEDRKKTGWIDLEQRFRTVILAEGGAGKTRELQERCRTLRQEGKSAWFIELEMLADDSIEDLLDLNRQLSDFIDWRDSSCQPAWIFLDAVDELKLRDGDFRRALFRLRSSIGAAHDRAHIIISCRPSDWDKIDIGYFSEQLPAPKVFDRVPQSGADERPNVSAEERFLAPLKGNPGMNSDNTNEEISGDDDAKPEELKIFKLRSLTRLQVEQFTVNRSPEIASEFLKAIEEDDRWAFARQPQDLLELLALWQQEKGRLGTYKQQHEAFLLSSLRERDGRPGEISQISQQIAREGAERLSLSLALSKKRTLLNVSEEVSVASTTASVCPRELLQDWPSPQIKSLLRLRTFDPPSYGRIKFHRRDLQEYLAAGRLLHLAKSGNDSMEKLRALLFSNAHPEGEILLPTMKGIAVWIASDSSEFGSRVRSRIINIEPELLLADGDPEHLPISSKIAILERIVELHSGGNRRSLSYSPASLKRFAEPELAPAITKIIESDKKSEPVVSLLLALVKEGRIAGCSEMLAVMAITPEYSNHWRALAVMGLVACEKKEDLIEIVRKILNRPQDWPAALLADIVDELAPTYLSVSQLSSVLLSIDKRGGDASPDFSQPIQRLADKIDGSATMASELKSALASLILENQLPGSAHYHPLSRWSCLSPALETLCLTCENSAVAPKDKEEFFDCLTAIWFRPERYYDTTKVEKLVEHVTGAGLQRSLLFQWELEYALNNFPSKPNEPMVVRRSLVRAYTQKDTSWLEELVKSERLDVRIRLSALLERIRLWNAQGRPQADQGALRELGGDGGVIDAHIEAYLAPRNPSPEEKEWEAISRKQENKEEKRLKGWLEWRQKLLDDPRGGFAAGILPHNRHLLLEWLMADNGRNGSYLVWGGGRGIAAAFSEGVREAAGAIFTDYWREAEVRTYSEQEGERSTTKYSWIYALTGVSIESETPGWATRLSEDDVRQATRIAMVEINGLASYLEQLIHDRPQQVKEVLCGEFAAQWAKRSEVSYLPLLQNAANGSPALKSLLLDTAIDRLLEWTNPSDLSGEAFGWVNNHLSQLIRVIQSSWQELSQEQLSAIHNLCDKTLRKDPESKFSPVWLRLLFNMDLNIAIGLLEKTIDTHPLPDRKDAAVRFFANLFGDRHMPIRLGSAGASPSPVHLARLIQIAYKHVVPTEDHKRPSGVCYTPDDRDDAEGVRSSLVNQLIEIDGPVADREIERLASSSECASIAEYLRARQRVKLENRADRIYSIAEISEIENRFESAPRDRDSLYRVMMARLDDLQDYLDTDDFVPLLTLQRIDSEEEMQRAMAMLLKHSSNGIYEIFREPEVKGRKRTDIQFCVPGFDVQSVIEIKVGEKPAWKVDALLNALEDQLVNRYLLQRNRKAGCFLITYGGHVSECSKCGDGFKPRKKWKDPDSGQLLDFQGLIERLRARAKEIEDEHNGEIRLGVFGLDLRDPISRKPAAPAAPAASCSPPTTSSPSTTSSASRR